MAKLSFRAVDEQGVLMVKKTPLPRGLPILYHAPLPAKGEGKPWGDAGVLTAARTAARFQSTFSRLGISAMTSSKEGIILWAPRARIIWGGLPEDEPSLARKEKRLLAAFDQILSLDAISALHPWVARGLWMYDCDMRQPETMQVPHAN